MVKRDRLGSVMGRLQTPKIFISYCRSSQGRWAVELATRLRNDGVDVQMDVWHLKPGDDMYAFMERMVTDRSVAKVLILCDKEYCERSNKRKGGVGVEAQIISPALYGAVAQSKFIPILREFRRSKAVMPAYLMNRYALDFSSEAGVDQHYPLLLDLIYGVEREIPPLGRSKAGQRPTITTSMIGAGLAGMQVQDPKSVDPAERLARAQGLIRDDPSAHGYSLAGTLLAASGLHRTAIKYFVQAVEMDDNQPTAWFNLGQAYELIGNYGEASDAFIRALRLRRDFAKMLSQHNIELLPRVRAHLLGSEDRYKQLLDDRSRLMENAINELRSPISTEENALLKIGEHRVKRGSNLAQFIIRLEPDGYAMVFCYPEELHDAEIVLPFRVPEGLDFTKEKLRFIDHFGYQEFEFNQESRDPVQPMTYFAGRLDLAKLSRKYLLRWIIRSVLFQEAGESFLAGRPYWEVQLEDSEGTSDQLSM